MKSLMCALALIISACSPTYVAAEQSVQYVTQMLEPTGGKILRPTEWFYSEHHAGPAFTWTLSKEDSRNGEPYATGVKIQAFTGVKGITGKTAKEFILDFAAAKKQSAEKIVSSCGETIQGLFTRICLETVEGPYRIMYSMFWGTGDLDLAIVSISGTTTALWDTYAPVFQKMSVVDLVDMKQFDTSTVAFNPLDAVSVYLVPLADFPQDLASSLAKRLQQDLNLRVKASLQLPPLNLSTLPGTNQYVLEDILSLGSAASASFPEAGPTTYRIFLTLRDINSRSGNFRFQFSAHNKSLNCSVISLARLLEYTNNQPVFNERASTRLMKMTKRAIGEMRFGWPRSTDRSDLMYSPIMSLDDLDRLGLEHKSADKALVAENYRMIGVTMLQPDFVLSQRVSDPNRLADYISRLSNTLGESAKSHLSAVPAGGHIVVGVRPRGKSKVWLALEPPLPAPLANKLIMAAQLVPPPQIKGGTVVFGMKVSFWGGAAEGVQPYPAQWRAIAKKHSQPIEAANLADLAWGSR